MEQKMKVVVLGASRYAFEDEKSGREIEGCKVHYVPIAASTENNQKGLIPKAETMEYSFFNELGTVPGLYEATVTFSMSSKNIKAKVSNFSFIEPVTFELPVTAKA
ncbi:hypothetical protein [Paenibacillus thiaminolyticus]|uniref:Uncharacterized protein n=1 Tax=Paenibacillus thiaminolyticus TaxID=49283 RepID=A0A3A3GIR3_PANTH|nr:hypothetical protein [Paenibacillus thiaminolyticus]RJG23305.1 hypothetical protein DQX05_13735 [Paenibacillus thiaminolyticus]RJG23322.1 hypothetical protein DQX05_13825 [Paenibacillus thiaminolyticus]